jgi:hypothetical protein
VLVEASRLFVSLVSQEGSERGQECGDGEASDPVAEPGSGGEAGAAQEDSRRHPPSGDLQAGTSLARRSIPFPSFSCYLECPSRLKLCVEARCV